jgi:hypothetical protein
MIGWIPAIVLRLLLPFLIPYFPLAGSLAAMLGDTVDVRLWELMGAQALSVHYNLVDKVLDNYMYLFMAYVAWGWKNKKARNLALGLLGYRTLGVMLYIIFAERYIYLFFPDVFVFFFFFYLIYLKLVKKDGLTTYKRLLLVIAVLTIPKLYQEYLFHVVQIPLYATIKGLFGWN